MNKKMPLAHFSFSCSLPRALARADSRSQVSLPILDQRSVKTKQALAPLIVVVAVLGIVTAWVRLTPIAAAQAQHQEHDQRDVDSYGNEHEGRKGQEERVVHLNAAQLSGLKLTNLEVKRGSLTTIVELPGEVSWNADRLVHITPRVSGIVATVEKTLGDRVEQGDVLCVLDSREMGDAKMKYLVDQSRFEVARADFERATIVYHNTKKLLTILEPQPTPEEALAKAHDLPVGDNKNKLLTSYTRMKVNFRNYQRNKNLLASKIASEAEFLEAKGNYEVSRADYLSTREEISFDLELRFLRAGKDFQVAETEMRNAERALHILGLTNKQTAEITQQGKEIDADISRAALYSPISGIIVDRHLTRGEFVSTDTPLYTIADLSNVWVIGRAYERDIRFLKPGQETTVGLDAFPSKRFDGQVDYVASQLDRDSRTVQVRVVLTNPQERIRAGMFGTVVIHIAQDAGTTEHTGLLVPIAALQRMGGGFVVFQATGLGEYRVVPVQVLGKSREFAEVTGAVNVGDKIAVGDTFVLKSEANKEQIGEGDED